MPYPIRTNVRQRKGRDDRHHTNDRATPPTQRVPGNSGPPSDTAAPWLHPGGASRSGARPAGTTDHARPAHAAGGSPTTRRALSAAPLHELAMDITGRPPAGSP